MGGVVCNSVYAGLVQRNALRCSNPCTAFDARARVRLQRASPAVAIMLTVGRRGGDDDRQVRAAVLGCLLGGVLAGAATAQDLPIDARIDAIVRAAMERDHLKAALVGVSVDGRQELHAWGESMTGVPATPDMHFRNGAVAIAYLGTLLLQLHDKGALELDDAARRPGSRTIPRRTGSRRGC